MKRRGVKFSWFVVSCVLLGASSSQGQEASFGLVIDVTGESFLVNLSRDPVWINGYTIADLEEPGRLDWEDWTPISETAESDPGRVTGTLGQAALDFLVANPGPNNLTELNPGQGGYWHSGQAWSIGEPFGIGPFNAHDIVSILDKFTISFSSPGPQIEYRLLRFVLQGDANRDGLVALDDFATFKANFGSIDATFEEGDFNLDSVVGLGDFNLIKSSFGLNANSIQSNGGAGVPAPEPSGLILAALGTSLLGWFTWRRSRG